MKLIEIPLYTVSNETSSTDKGGMKPPVVIPLPEGTLLNADNILTIKPTITFKEWRKRSFHDEVETTPIVLTPIDMVGGSYGR